MHRRTPASWRNLPLATAFGNPTWLGKRAEKPSPPGEICLLAGAFDISARPGKRAEEPPPLGEIYPLTAAFDISAGRGKYTAESPTAWRNLSPLRLRLAFPQGLAGAPQQAKLLLFYPGNICVCGPCLRSEAPGSCGAGALQNAFALAFSACSPKRRPLPESTPSVPRQFPPPGQRRRDASIARDRAPWRPLCAALPLCAPGRT